MENEIYSILSEKREKQEIAKLLACNEKTGSFGLVLTEADSRELMLCRNESLKKHKRIEFGEGILDKLIFVFCDSEYLYQDTYKETIERLQDIFYEFKNETMDELTDEELIEFMREQYDEICFGDLDYLESTCLERFGRGIRKGFADDHRTDGTRGQYKHFDEETRWDQELYYQTLKDLF